MSDPVLVLREALAKATEGPWDVDVSHEDADSGGDPNVPDEYWTLEISAGDESLLYSATLDDPTDDVRLIVAARNLLPVLLDEVEALRKVVDGVTVATVVWAERRERYIPHGPDESPTLFTHGKQLAYAECIADLQRLLAVLDKEEAK